MSLRFNSNTSNKDDKDKNDYEKGFEDLLGSQSMSTEKEKNLKDE